MLDKLEDALKKLHVANENFEHKFKQVAELLMNEYALEYKGKHFYLDEIEFYLCSDTHKDCYSHSYIDRDEKCGQKKNNSQGDMLKWYFHGSGMDITFGNKNSNVYGGVLIRKIFDPKINCQKDKTDGPLKLRNHIAGKSLDKSDDCIAEYKMDIRNGDLRLVADSTQEQIAIIPLPRHGLNPIKEKDTTFEFYCKPYRFLRIRE